MNSELSTLMHKYKVSVFLVLNGNIHIIETYVCSKCVTVNMYSTQVTEARQADSWSPTWLLNIFIFRDIHGVLHYLTEVFYTQFTSDKQVAMKFFGICNLILLWLC